jgi:hypothetical protein
MGKYTKKRKKKNASWRVVLLIVLAALLAGAIWMIMLLPKTDIPELPTASSDQSDSLQSGEPSKDETSATETEAPEDPVSQSNSSMPSDLQIVHIRSYSGVFMEDGSDEIVSDVMMLVLENISAQDLQLARIDIRYPEFTAEFEVTNLPAGEKAVLLEKNRHSMPEEEYTSIESRNIAFFETPMTLMQDTFEITGGNGYLDVKNISGSATGSKVHVYYKHAASDLLYGGITFRATVNQSIAPGETIRILTNHYTAENSRILSVTCAE